MRARTRAAAEAEEAGEAADGGEHVAASGRENTAHASEVEEFAKSQPNTKLEEEENNDPELMCSQLMAEVTEGVERVLRAKCRGYRGVEVIALCSLSMPSSS